METYTIEIHMEGMSKERADELFGQFMELMEAALSADEKISSTAGCYITPAEENNGEGENE